MRHFSTAIFLCLLVNCLQAQVSYNEDSLRGVLNSNPHDSIKVTLLLQLCGSYFFKQPDTSLLYAEQALKISRSLKSTKYILNSLNRAGSAMRQTGKLVESIKYHLAALELSQKAGDETMEAYSYGFMGCTYFVLGGYEDALYNLKRALASSQKFDGGEDVLFMVYTARAYNEKNNPDSAFYFLAKAKKALRQSQGPRMYRRYEPLAHTIGDAFLLRKELDSADYYYRLALYLALKSKDFIPGQISAASVRLANIFMHKNMIDSALYFARYAYMIVRQTKLDPRIIESTRILVQLHRKAGRLDSAFYYQDITNALNNSINGKDKLNQLQLLSLQRERHNQETLRNEERSESNQRLIASVSITVIILIASILLFRSNRIKQKSNLVLQKTLGELKATQSQLVQSEKMASLGELTAGIAHEIQNPLNFVNNFSEVNEELIDELKKEVVSGNQESVIEIANAIKSNQEKINHHGKRADGIVKSMLQHSRSSSGQQELTDISELCDEYVRLTYHGYRAKDKSFNAKMNVHFDPLLPKIKIVQQDIGRVLLNLINNAFYAVNEKARLKTFDYEPAVTISTRHSNGSIEICVQDNGNGIANSMKAKIFQPFFTTKPAGQGTGLGLSLSYDIIKAHGGTILVNSIEGEGAEFIIQLPI